MEILYLLIPLSVALVFGIGVAFWWSLRHGQFDDLPVELFFNHLRQCYPHLFEVDSAFLRGDLQAEVAAMKRVDS